MIPPPLIGCHHSMPRLLCVLGMVCEGQRAQQMQQKVVLVKDSVATSCLKSTRLITCHVRLPVPFLSAGREPKATGIVEYASAEDASRVVAHVHGKLILGRPVTAWVPVPGGFTE